MRKLIAISLVAATALSLVGCGETEGKIELGQYKGIEIYESDLDVSKKLEETIDSIISSHATDEKVEEGKVKKTDTVNIDYKGYIDVDGEPFQFDGGTSDKPYDLDIDNSTFIKGFAEGLVGKKVGKTVTLELTFPDDYDKATKGPDGKEIKLAGVDVTFEVTINYRTVKVEPEYNDEFIAKNYGAIAKTVADYEKYMTEKLQISAVIGLVWEDFEGTCKVSSYPSEELESYQTYLEDSQISQLQSYLSTDLDTYLEVCSMTKDEWEADVLNSAQEKIKYDMIISEIQAKEGLGKITAESADYKERAEKFAATTGMDLATIEMYYGQTTILSVLNEEIVQKFIFDNVKILEGDRPKDKTEDATEAATE